MHILLLIEVAPQPSLLSGGCMWEGVMMVHCAKNSSRLHQILPVDDHAKIACFDYWGVHHW
jgi:hypothetical protein